MGTNQTVCGCLGPRGSAFQPVELTAPQSSGDRGNFYEGYMTTGVTSDATDDAVQANIVSVGYKTLPSVHCQEVGHSICYKDRPGARIMGEVVVANNGMTREQCMRACFERQKRLAGVENGDQCMCSDSIADGALPSTNCTKTCHGSTAKPCGGWMAISVLNFTCSLMVV